VGHRCQALQIPLGSCVEHRWQAGQRSPVGAGSARDGAGMGDVYSAGDAAYAAATVGWLLTNRPSHRHRAKAASAMPVNTCIIASLPKVDIT